MANISPISVIARGAKLNPAATKILFAVPVLLACVALGKTLVADAATAIIGGILTIVVAIILLVVVSTGPQLLGGVGIWLARFCFAIFCVVTMTLFISWISDRPRPLGCLMHPDTLCAADVRKSDASPNAVADNASQLLMSYLFLDNKSGAVYEARLNGLSDALTRRGKYGLSIPDLLYDPKLAGFRQELAKALYIDEYALRDSRA